ncbi:MAG: hypothetical protein KC475_12640, partial [Cyanobacteria bacterium HKST-UBA03]|nr:hypothetical protein [Cyanobacteria bacterium HKST-UBA03]
MSATFNRTTTEGQQGYDRSRALAARQFERAITHANLHDKAEDKAYFSFGDMERFRDLLQALDGDTANDSTHMVTVDGSTISEAAAIAELRNTYGITDYVNRLVSSEADRSVAVGLAQAILHDDTYSAVEEASSDYATFGVDGGWRNVSGWFNTSFSANDMHAIAEAAYMRSRGQQATGGGALALEKLSIVMDRNETANLLQADLDFNRSDEGLTGRQTGLATYDDTTPQGRQELANDVRWVMAEFGDVFTGETFATELGGEIPEAGFGTAHLEDVQDRLEALQEAVATLT